jgi:hypothetical protein
MVYYSALKLAKLFRQQILPWDSSTKLLMTEMPFDCMALNLQLNPL